MDYPTPEEEYELLYGDELELMDDFEGKREKKIENVLHRPIFSEPENAVPKAIASTQKSAAHGATNASIISSPALSQISRIGINFTPDRTAIKKTSVSGLLASAFVYYKNSNEIAISKNTISPHNDSQCRLISDSFRAKT